jgi:flagellar basal-body rod protein FlgF
MRVGQYAAAIGSMHQQRRMDVIANNIANASTPGFKKDGVSFNDFLQEVTYTSMDQGPIRETGNKLDVALVGAGFLKAQTDQGVLYTRAGNLELNADKEIVTQDGWPVLGSNGPIKVEKAQTLRIEEDGQVFDDDTKVDTIDVVKFPPEAALRKVRGGYFEPTSKDVQPVAATDCTVRQGALEGANFNPVEEMVDMVETSRNFEAYQKTLQIFDRDLDAQLISKLAG